MSGTHLFYNGVLLRDCELQDWSQEIVRDDSGTDVLYSKVTLSVESTLVSLGISGGMFSMGGLLAPSSTTALPALGTETLVDRIQEIEYRLSETRKDFWLAINAVTDNQPTQRPAANGSTNASYRVVLAATGLTNEDAKKLIDTPTASLGKISAFRPFADVGTQSIEIERKLVIDMNNGPKPIRAVVTRVMGGRSVRVRFTIEVCRCFCFDSSRYEEGDSSNQSLPPSLPPVLDAGRVEGVISNRWSLTETMDADWKTEHQIEGKLIVSDVRYKPHAMRLVVTPNLFAYAKLVSRSFATDKTGLILAYRFAIKEAGPAAPNHLIDWEGTYREQHARGGRKMGSVSVKVTGKPNPKDYSNAADPHQEQKRYMLAMADRIARSRVRWSAQLEAIPGAIPKDTRLVDYSVIENMKSPSLELNILVEYNDPSIEGRVLSDRFGLRLRNMGRSMQGDVALYDPDYNPKVWPSPDPFPWDTSHGATDEEKSTYYDCYFQECCSDWHATPRGHVQPDSVAHDTPPSTTTTTANTTTTLLFNPSLTADTLPPGTVDVEQNGWDANQNKFAYIQSDIDTTYDVNAGKVALPLSKARSGQTAIAVRLHAGIAYRIVRFISTRQGDWPIIPAPQSLVYNGDITETFLNGEIIPDAPKLDKDGKTFVYSLQVRWVYLMSRPPNRATYDTLAAGSSPWDRTTPATNAIPLTKYLNYGGVFRTHGSGGPIFGD